MKYYTFTDADKKATAYQRCFGDAENGRLWLSFLRLNDLRGQFPNDADIDYAEGLLLLEHLGEGINAQELFWKAYQRNPQLKEALFNAAKFSPDQNTFDLRIAEARRIAPDERGIQELYQNNVHFKGEKEPFWKFLLSMLVPDFAENRPGDYASVIQLILKSGGDDIPPADYAHFVRVRGECLRKIDRKAEARLQFLGEHFRPEDRLALKHALDEFEQNIHDPYFRNQETLNLCGVYSMLLGLYEKALKYADQAILAGGVNYIYAHRTRALVLWEMGQKRDCITLEEAMLRKASLLGDNTQVDAIKKVLEMHNKYQPSNLAEFKPNMNLMFSGVGDAAFDEITQGKSKIGGIAAAFRTRLGMLGTGWNVGYIPVMAEMFAFFSPEASHFILDEAIKKMPAQNQYDFITNVITASIFIAVHSKGVLQRDATRWLTLRLLSPLDAKSIRIAYRQLIQNISLAAVGSSLSSLSDLVNNELSRISPHLPGWLDDQSPMSSDEEALARTFISERITPTPAILESKVYWNHNKAPGVNQQTNSDNSMKSKKNGCALVFLLLIFGIGLLLYLFL